MSNDEVIGLKVGDKLAMYCDDCKSPTTDTIERIMHTGFCYEVVNTRSTNKKFRWATVLMQRSRRVWTIESDEYIALYGFPTHRDGMRIAGADLLPPENNAMMGMFGGLKIP